MIRVGVIRGGISSERGVSINSGASVLSILQNELSSNYSAIDIVISEHGVWNIDNKEIQPDDLKSKIDIAFIALHGIYGEDGQIQSLLESLDIPYTGSGPLASRIAIDKWTTKEYARKLGINVSKDVLFEQYDGNLNISYEVFVSDVVAKIVSKLAPPWVVKPVTSGSSVGVSIVDNATRLQGVLVELLNTSTILIEEYIAGKEGTVGVIENFRGQDVYPFLPIEIRTPKAKFFDFESKYNGEAQEISPGNFSVQEKKVMQDYSIAIHRGIGLRDYSRSDFIVGKNGKIYFLEVNNLPGLTKESLLPKSLPPVGATFSQLIDHLIKLALARKIV